MKESLRPARHHCRHIVASCRAGDLGIGHSSSLWRIVLIIDDCSALRSHSIHRIFKYVNQDYFSGLWLWAQRRRIPARVLRLQWTGRHRCCNRLVRSDSDWLDTQGFNTARLTQFPTRVVLLNQQLLIWSTRYASVRLLCNEIRYDLSLVNNVNLLSVDRDPRIDISMY